MVQLGVHGVYVVVHHLQLSLIASVNTPALFQYLLMEEFTIRSRFLDPSNIGQVECANQVDIDITHCTSYVGYQIISSVGPVSQVGRAVEVSVTLTTHVVCSHPDS